MLTPVASAGPVANIEFRIKFSRHARNEMRLYRIELGDIEAAIAQPVSRSRSNSSIQTWASASRLLPSQPGINLTVKP
jgi:hypothetical protein